VINLGKIIIDTSSILFALSKKIDIFDSVRDELEMKPLVSRGVLNELSRMSRGSSRKARDAKVALAMIKKHLIDVSPDNTYVDSWILSQAGSVSAICTNDTELRKNLRSKGATVYTLSEGGKFR
jgi:rRNA-processing protein FCF1